MKYRITDYDERYRPYDKSGNELKRADWVKLPANPKGDGLQTLLRHPKGLQIFAVWCLLLEKTTAEKKPENRGKLLNHKEEPATISEIAQAISLPNKAGLVKTALSVLATMGWINAEGTSAEFPETSPKSRVEKSREEKIYVEQFNVFREAYQGTKRGSNTEFDNLRQKHSDWETVLPLLLPAVNRQIVMRKRAAAEGRFVPPWKNLKTWINQRGWEEVMGQESIDAQQARQCKVCGRSAVMTIGSDDFCGQSCYHQLLGQQKAASKEK